MFTFDNDFHPQLKDEILKHHLRINCYYRYLNKMCNYTVTLSTQSTQAVIEQLIFVFYCLLSMYSNSSLCLIHVSTTVKSYKNCDYSLNNGNSHLF